MVYSRVRFHQDHRPTRRSIAQRTDAELDEYCRQYNIGWVVAWSPGAVERFHKWQGGVRPLAKVADENYGEFFQVLHPSSSFALFGNARVLQADYRSITLADVAPRDGKVVLSFHFQKGLHASPDRVQVEREQSTSDLVPLIRLRVNSYVSRVTLTWEDP
jgi:hypothetical protein